MSLIFQPKWSNVPLHFRCDYETFKKLKQLKKWLWEAVYADARERRWYAKRPHNRSEQPPMPPVWPLFSALQLFYIRKSGDHPILLWHNAARMPAPSPLAEFRQEELDCINRMYEQGLRWHAELPALCSLQSTATQEGIYEVAPLQTT